MKAVPIVVAAVLGLAMPGSSWARTPDVTSAAPPPTLIALGCGANRTRDAAGHCRRRFNLFQQHGQFRTFKSRHCTKITTPNGPVDRCKI